MTRRDFLARLATAAAVATIPIKAPAKTPVVIPGVQPNPLQAVTVPAKDRILLYGLRGQPENWYMSTEGDPFDWQFNNPGANHG